MSFLVIDTEATGLFVPDMPADGYNQPRLASVAMIALNDRCEQESEFYSLVQPDGWEMPLEATEIHGLTTDILNAYGVPVRDVLKPYSQFVSEGRTVVAFNAFYDTKVMRGELRRAQMPDLYGQTESFCLMHAMGQVVTPKDSRPRWLKLSEAFRYCFNERHERAHDALSDARAAARILKWLWERGRTPALV